MANQNFTNLVRHFVKGDIDYDTLTCKVLLVSSVPTETDFDTWVYRSSVSNEITGTGYTLGGIAQAFTLNALDTTNNKQTITYTNISNGWTAATFTTYGAIIYKNTGNAATDILLHFCDFGGAIGCTNGSFGITYTNSFEILC